MCTTTSILYIMYSYYRKYINACSIAKWNFTCCGM